MGYYFLDTQYTLRAKVEGTDTARLGAEINIQNLQKSLTRKGTKEREKKILMSSCVS